MGDVVEMVRGKKMELDVLERLTLLGILPKEGSFLNLKLIRLVREELSFNEEENKALQFRQQTGADGSQMLVWNTTKVGEDGQAVPACPAKEYVFGEVVEGLVVKALKDLDKAEKITQDHYSLYEKFMEGKE